MEMTGISSSVVKNIGGIRAWGIDCPLDPWTTHEAQPVTCSIDPRTHLR